MRNNYIVKYLAFDDKNLIIKRGKMRCRNKMSEFDAQASLEDHFKKKLPGFVKLIVTSCKIETNAEWLENIFGKIYK